MKRFGPQWIVSVCIADTPNRNKRVYSEAILKKVVADFEVDHPNGLLGRTVLGEERSLLERTGMTHVAEASHLVKKLKMYGKELVAFIEVLDNVAGRQLEACIRIPNTVEFGLFGTGTVTEIGSRGGDVYVQDDYKLISIKAIPTEATA